MTSDSKVINEIIEIKKKMNLFQQDSCLRILQVLSHNPCYRMFASSPLPDHANSVDRPLFFDFIHQKIDQKIYKSTSEFIYDVRTLLRNAQASCNTNIYRISASKMLSDIFERMLNQGYITHINEEERIFQISQAIKEYTKKSLKWQNKVMDLEPQACMFTQTINLMKEFGNSKGNSPPIDIPSPFLKAEMKALHSIDGIISAAEFVSLKQPECVIIGRSIVFSFNKMTQDTKLELHNLIQKKLREEAIQD